MNSLQIALPIHEWLSKDDASFAVQVSRDQNLVKDIQISSLSDHELVGHWWQAQLESGVSSAQSNTDQVAKWRSTLVAGLLVVGVIMGVSVCSLALQFGGQAPVNILTLFGVLVLIPALLLLLTIISIVANKLQWSPIKNAIDTFNVNRLAVGLWYRFVGANKANNLASRALSGGWGNLLSWQLVVFSQWMSIGFFIGAIGSFLLSVAFTDLAFGWSSTLELSASQVYGWFSSLSWPWAAWLPSANPSLELVDQSRYFRLAGGYSQSQAIQLGYWWPFVLCVIAFWGLLPRILALILGSWRLARADDAFLLAHPDVSALLDRLRHAHVAYDEDMHSVIPDADTQGATSSASLTQAGRLASWNGAAADVGVALDISQSDEERLALLDLKNLNSKPVVIYTKSWEPPLLEFCDWLGVLREHLDESCSVQICPLGLDRGEADAEDIAVWRRMIHGVGLDKVYVIEAQI